MTNSSSHLVPQANVQSVPFRVSMMPLTWPELLWEPTKVLAVLLHGLMFRQPGHHVCPETFRQRSSIVGQDGRGLGLAFFQRHRTATKN